MRNGFYDSGSRRSMCSRSAATDGVRVTIGVMRKRDEIKSGALSRSMDRLRRRPSPPQIVHQESESVHGESANFEEWQSQSDPILYPGGDIEWFGFL